ncbi:MAG: hypothetical protein HYZ53_28515 [Planctomycetes bacterium]|nr:hypothetical protein [Planctomycetota bacterium]
MRTFLAEGPEDLVALRALARDLGALEHKLKFEPGRRLVYNVGDRRIWIESADGKQKLAQRALDFAQGGAQERADLIGVCFDPDADTLQKEFDFFRNQLTNLVSSHKGEGGLIADPPRGYAFRYRARLVRVRPAPWRSAKVSDFDSLQPHHSLERLLLTGILRADIEGALGNWANQATTDLVALVSDHGWKRAFRIWNAALYPDAGGAGFVDALLQREPTRQPCLDALRGAVAAEVLRSVLCDAEA